MQLTTLLKATISNLNESNLFNIRILATDGI